MMSKDLVISEPVLVLIGLSTVFGVLIGVFIGRSPGRFLQIFRNFGRTLTAPLRRIGVMPRTVKQVKGVRNAAISGSKAAAFLEQMTEIERAIFLQRHGLYRPGEVVEIDEKTLKDLHKQATEMEERYLVRARGLYYTQVRTSPSYQPDWIQTGLDEETVSWFENCADTFFNSQVDLSANEQALYEDVDGAHSIYLFGQTDLAAYNLINEARKTINGNALKLIISFLGCMAAAFAAVLFGTGDSLLGLVPVGVAALLMLFSHFAYRNTQEHSIRSLAKFMQLYVGYISDQFRDVTGRALGVPVGREEDPNKLAAEAGAWNKIMVWMGLRSFFIETFLRNEQYQIFRNSGYYKLFSDVMVVLLLVFVGVGNYFGFYDLTKLINTDFLWVAIAAGVLIPLYLLLIRVNVITQELAQQDWRGFDNLKLGEKMDEVVGKYAEEIGYWKNRLER